MSNFAKGFRRARTGRLSGCDRVPERSGSATGKADRRRRLRERSETDFPPASPQTEDANRLTTTTRSREPSRKPAIAVSGRQPLPAPNRKRRKPLSISRRCKGRRNPDAPNGENETGYSTKTRQFFYGNKARFDLSTSTSPTWNAASRSTTGPSV